MTTEEIKDILRACNFNGCNIGNIVVGNEKVDIYGNCKPHEQNANDNEPKDRWQDAEVVDCEEVVDSNDEADNHVKNDNRFERAIAAVGKSPYFKFQYDWTWTKVASEDDRVGLPVLKTDEYINKLSVLKVGKLPSRTDIDFHYSKVHQIGSVYSFTDTQKVKEVDRRNKLINTFIGEYNKEIG